MENHEYGLAIPLAQLYERANHPGPDCHPDSSVQPSACALRVVEAMLCPCIRGDACVCRALAREFEYSAHRTRAARRRVDMTHREIRTVDKPPVTPLVNPDQRVDERQDERRERLDRALDAALADTFPASDPIALV